MNFASRDIKYGFGSVLGTRFNSYTLVCLQFFACASSLSKSALNTKTKRNLFRLSRKTRIIELDSQGPKPEVFPPSPLCRSLSPLRR